MELKCYNNKNEQITHLTQWDLNQQIFIKDLSISSEIEVHATNLHREKAFICESSYLGTTLSFEVPNILLQEPASLKIYIYVKEADTSAKTVYTIRIPVIPRAKPVSYEFTNNAENITYEEFVKAYEEAQALKTQLQNVLNNVSSMKVEQEVDEDGIKAVSGSAVASYVTERLSEVNFGDISIDIDTDAVKEYVDDEISKVKTTFFDTFPIEAEIQALPNNSYFTVRQRGIYREDGGNDMELVTYHRTKTWISNALQYEDTDGSTIYVVPINQPVGELYMSYYGIKTGIENAESNSAIMSFLTQSCAQYGSTFRFPVGNFYFSEPIDASARHISIIGTCDTNHKNFDKSGVTFLHFTDLANDETALTVRQCRLSDFVICGTAEQYDFSLDRGDVQNGVEPTLNETVNISAYGIKAGGGMLIKNVGFKYFYHGCWIENTNAFIDGVTFHHCHYGLSIGTDIKVNNISGADVMVLLQLRGSLCSAVGVRGDSVGQHLVEITGGGGYTLVDLDADFCMDAIVAIDGDVRDINITGIHGRSGVSHFFKTGDTEITANDITDDTVGEFGIIAVKGSSTLNGAYIVTNQSSINCNPFDETIGTETTYEVPYVLLSAGAGAKVNGVQFVSTYYQDEELTEEWAKKRIASLSSSPNSCFVKVQTSKGSIIYEKDENGLVKVLNDAEDIFSRIDMSSYAKDAEVVKTVNDIQPDENGNVVIEIEKVEPEVVQSADEFVDTSKKYVLPDGYIYAYRRRFVAGATTPNFKNQLPLALNPVTEDEILDGVGYKQDTFYCLNSDTGLLTEYDAYEWSGGSESIANRWSTGLIPVKNDDIVRINAMGCTDKSGAAIFHIVATYEEALACYHIRGYDLVGNDNADPKEAFVNEAKFTSSGSGENVILSDVEIPITSTFGWTLGKYGGEAKYVILFINDTTPPEDVIITVNEEITYTVTEDHYVWEWVNTGEQYYAVDYLDMINKLDERITEVESNISDNDSSSVDIETIKTNLGIFTDVPGITTSANLCANEWEYGWINDDGSNRDDFTPITVSFRDKNYIEVEGGRELCQNNNNNHSYKIWQYDVDKNIISASDTFQASVNIYSGSQKFTLDENTKYVRIACYTTDAADLSTVQLNLYYYENRTEMFADPGNVFVYVPRYTSVGGFIDSKKVLTPLTGKKIVYDGDSICMGLYGGGGYAKLIADTTNGAYENQSYGGARLVTRTDDGHSVVDNLVNLPTDGDLYCFQGGINDYWTYGVLGTYDYTNFDGELDTTTVCGALETIFRYAINNFVGKPICFVITHKIQKTAYVKNSNENTFEDYRNAMVGICNKYSIPYYDAFNDSGLNGWNTVQNNAYLTGNSEGTADGCHPNEDGYKKYYVPQLIALFEKIMPGD